MITVHFNILRENIRILFIFKNAGSAESPPVKNIYKILYKKIDNTKNHPYNSFL